MANQRAVKGIRRTVVIGRKSNILNVSLDIYWIIFMWLFQEFYTTLENSHILPLLIFDTILYPVSTNSQYERELLCRCLKFCEPIHTIFYFCFILLKINKAFLSPILQIWMEGLFWTIFLMIISTSRKRCRQKCSIFLGRWSKTRNGDHSLSDCTIFSLWKRGLRND